MKTTIVEVRDWLLENRLSENGDLYLGELDFSNFDGNIYMGGMKVKHSLYRGACEVGGNLFQGDNNVNGHLNNEGNNVGGDLAQSWNKVKGNFYSERNQVYGNISQTQPTKLLKKISAEELAKMGYVYEGDN